MDAVREDMTVAEVTEEDGKIGPNGDGKSAVATLDGRSRKKMYMLETPDTLTTFQTLLPTPIISLL